MLIAILVLSELVAFMLGFLICYFVVKNPCFKKCGNTPLKDCAQANEKEQVTQPLKSNEEIKTKIKLVIAEGDLGGVNEKGHLLILRDSFTDVPIEQWNAAKEVYIEFVGPIPCLGRPYAVIECWDVLEITEDGLIVERRIPNEAAPATKPKNQNKKSKEK